MGRVSTQAQIMRETIPHLTALSRLVAPTPMMDAEMTWVVERGMPMCEAMPMMAAEVVSAAKP